MAKPTEILCVRCGMDEVKKEGERCDHCEAKFQTEVAETLQRNNLTREQVSQPIDENDPMAILQEANSPSPIEAKNEPTDTKQHWTSDLSEEYKASQDAKPVEPINASLLPDHQMITESLQTSRVNTKEAGQQVTTNLIPHMGDVMTRIDPTSIAFGFPPAVDTLIKKTQLSPEASGDLVAKFRDLFTLTAQMRNRLALVNPQSVDDVEAIAEAKDLFKTIRDERLNAEKRKKIIKDPYLRPGQLIDGIFRIWMDELSPLEAEAKRKAEYVENLERERKAKLAEERKGKLALFEVYDVAGFNLGELDDAGFDVIYQGAMSSYQTRKAEEQRLENERLEKERQNELERQRLAEENVRLQQEREDADRRAAEKDREAREAREAQEKAEADLRRQEELRLAEERRVAAEAETKRLADEAAAEAQRLAPDRDKLLLFADELEKFAVPEVDAKFAGLISIVEDHLRSAVGHIRQNVDKH